MEVDGLELRADARHHGLHDLVQEKLRSSAFGEVPFFDQKAVVALLDGGGLEAAIGAWAVQLE
jgi:hypothetical protein